MDRIKGTPSPLFCSQFNERLWRACTTHKSSTFAVGEYRTQCHVMQYQWIPRIFCWGSGCTTKKVSMGFQTILTRLFTIEKHLHYILWSPNHPKEDKRPVSQKNRFKYATSTEVMQTKLFSNPREIMQSRRADETKPVATCGSQWGLGFCFLFYFLNEL